MIAVSAGRESTLDNHFRYASQPCCSLIATTIVRRCSTRWLCDARSEVLLAVPGTIVECRTELVVLLVAHLSQ